jgi:hypothetical protein
VRRVTLEKGADGGSAEGNFANRCPHYGAMQEDYLLYSEPGDVFFETARRRQGGVESPPLERRIQVKGDYGFGA